MELKEQVLTALMQGEKSGGKIANSLGVSRAAVWKCIEALRADGYNISAVTGRGYSLDKDNLLSSVKVRHYLKTEWTVETLKTATSTNDVAKLRASEGKNFHAVIADTQTAGRGRMKRAFFSPVGAGLYLSALVRPKLTIAQCGLITAFAGVATARGIESLCDVKVDVKWVNDLYIGGKKMCGILTESSFSLESGTPEYAVIGIGVNILDNPFPSELKGKATSLERESGIAVDRCRLAAAILDRLHGLEAEIERGEFIDEYRARSCIIGKTVTVNDAYEAEVLGIEDDCSLRLRRGEQILKFSAGEVSLKL